MAGRYNRSKKGRSHGAYRRRLLRAGLTRAPKMTRYAWNGDRREAER